MLRAGGGRGIFKRATTAAAGGGAWSPADVTLTNVMRGDWLDSAATMYTNTTATTPATANADPIGAMPSGRGEDIAGYAYSLYKPYLDNMTYAPSLLLGDATHNRAVRFTKTESQNLLYPNGSIDAVQRGATTRSLGLRVRMSEAVVAWLFDGFDNAPYQGPGIGIGTNYKWGAAVGQVDVTEGTADATADAWQTMVFYSDADGGRLYVDSATAPVLNDPSLTPSSLAVRSLFLLSDSAVGFDFFRCFAFGDVDLSEIPVAGAMAWLEGA